MTIKLWDKYDRPPVGARVYVKEQHFLGTVTSHSYHGNRFFVEIDGERVTSINCLRKEVQIIGPPELLNCCTIVTCPLCEEDIRIRKDEE